jgi:hypothetical protein
VHDIVALALHGFGRPPGALRRRPDEQVDHMLVALINQGGDRPAPPSGDRRGTDR